MEVKIPLLLGRKAITYLDSILISRDIALPTKIKTIWIVKALFFPVVMCKCKNWTIKKLSTEELMILNCGVGEDSWESLGQQGNQPWIFIGRTHGKTEDLVLGPPDAKSSLIGRDLDAGKNWRQEEKLVTEDRMFGWHHWLSGYESEQNSRRQWKSGKPGVLQYTGSQRVGHKLATE